MKIRSFIGRDDNLISTMIKILEEAFTLDVFERALKSGQFYCNLLEFLWC